MRSILIGLLMALPLAALAGNNDKPVMYADCECEIMMDDGTILDARSQLGFLPSPIPMENSNFTALGEYNLDLKGSVGPFHNSVNDKYCTYDEDEQLNMSCLFAVAMSQRRAQGDCQRRAKRQSENATGSLVPNSCLFRLEGSTTPEPSIP